MLCVGTRLQVLKLTVTLPENMILCVLFRSMHPNVKSNSMFILTHPDSETLTSFVCAQGVTTEQSVVRDVKAFSNGV